MGVGRRTPRPDLPAPGHVHNACGVLLWQAIGKLFEKTMMLKFGPENVKEHFAAFDTICDATQARQRPPITPREHPWYPPDLVRPAVSSRDLAGAPGRGARDVE